MLYPTWALSLFEEYPPPKLKLVVPLERVMYCDNDQQEPEYCRPGLPSIVSTTI
jgi:hypothetical protein